MHMRFSLTTLNPLSSAHIEHLFLDNRATSYKMHSPSTLCQAKQEKNTFVLLCTLLIHLLSIHGEGEHSASRGGAVVAGHAAGSGRAGGWRRGRSVVDVAASTAAGRKQGWMRGLRHLRGEGGDVRRRRPHPPGGSCQHVHPRLQQHHPVPRLISSPSPLPTPSTYCCRAGHACE